MKVSTTKIPKPVVIEVHSDNTFCDILLADNLEETERITKNIKGYIKVTKNDNGVVISEETISIAEAGTLAASGYHPNVTITPIYDYTKSKVYTYDSFRLRNMRYRESLGTDITNNIGSLVALARAKEIESREGKEKAADNLTIQELNEKIELLNKALRELILTVTEKLNL